MPCSRLTSPSHAPRLATIAYRLTPNALPTLQCACLPRGGRGRTSPPAHPTPGGRDGLQDPDEPPEGAIERGLRPGLPARARLRADRARPRPPLDPPRIPRPRQ